MSSTCSSACPARQRQRRRAPSRRAAPCEGQFQASNVNVHICDVNRNRRGKALAPEQGAAASGRRACVSSRASLPALVSSGGPERQSLLGLENERAASAPQPAGSSRRIESKRARSIALDMRHVNVHNTAHPIQSKGVSRVACRACVCPCIRANVAAAVGPEFRRGGHLS